MTKTVALLPELVERPVDILARTFYEWGIGRGNDYGWTDAPKSIRDRCYHAADAGLRAIEATRTQTDKQLREEVEPKLERLEAKWLKWPDGDAGDAIDFALGHLSDSFEMMCFLERWREGRAGEWPGYVRWLNTQRDGARSSLSSAPVFSHPIYANEPLSPIKEGS